MGISQLLIFAVMAGVAFFVFTRMKKMQGQAAGSFAQLTASLDSEFASIRRPGESEPAFVSVATRNVLKKNHGFMIAATNQQLLVKDLRQPAPLRAFDLAAVKIAAPRKKWTDTGNMQTTVSEGWEVSMQLPAGEAYDELRLYAEDPYLTAQAANVPRFLAAIGA